jgi:hypothetical protein
MATGAPEARGWPRRPRTPPRTPYRGVLGVRGSTVGARTPRMRTLRGSMRGSRSDDRATCRPAQDHIQRLARYAE